MAVDSGNVGVGNAEATFDVVLASELVNQLPQASAALRNLTVIPMGTFTERIPVLSALPTATFLTADQEVKPKSATAWKNVWLQAEEIAVIVPISENVIADSSIDVVSRTTSLIVQEFGRVLDAARESPLFALIVVADDESFAAACRVTVPHIERRTEEVRIGDDRIELLVGERRTARRSTPKHRGAHTCPTVVLALEQRFH